MINKVSGAEFLKSLFRTLHTPEYFSTTMFVSNLEKNDRRDRCVTKICPETEQDTTNIEMLSRVVFEVLNHE
jgi:hypothetical protein